MIFQFTDYRKYLKDYFKRLPRKGFGEAKRIAEHLRVSSTYMSHVLSGSKLMTLEQATALSAYLGLSELEAEYFFYLVEQERAGTHELKSYCGRKLDELRNKSLKLVNRVQADRVMSEQERAVFYSNPMYSAIHLYCSTAPKGRSLEEVVSRFDLPRAKAGEILRFLAETGLCAQVENRFRITTQATHLEHGSPHLLKHHANWRLRSIQAAENLSEEELMYTMNVTLSRKDFAVLREEMVGFIKQAQERIYPSPPEELACLNLDWYWIRK